jgi:hypothetical protein
MNTTQQLKVGGSLGAVIDGLSTYQDISFPIV